MRGVDNIVRMRLAGSVPSVVWVEMLPMQQWTRMLTDRSGRHVDIHLGPKDASAIELRDLRCLTGVPHVLVNGPDDESTERVAKACFDAGAKVVEAFRYDLTNPHRVEITQATRFAAEGVKTVWPR